MVPAAAEGSLDHDQPLDILGDMDFLDSSLWDPSVFFSDDNVMVDETEPEAAPARERERERETSSEDLAKVFLEWLKSNRDSISPEDLRSIKLKKSTIEAAARRLGGGTQGMMQLLKLILTWVQNHHLERKKRSQRDQSPCPPLNPNPSYNYEHGVTWVLNSPYQMDQSSFPCYAHVPSPAFHFQNTTGNQQFSPAPEFLDPATAWHAHFGTSQAHHYSPLPPTPFTAVPIAGGCFPVQFQSNQFFQPSDRLTRMASATKEARKKRMARQRRVSALHHHHHHHHHNNRNRQLHSQPSRSLLDGESSQQCNVNFSSTDHKRQV